jgi:hypothetical protein
MTWFSRRVSFVVAFFLLTSAATASAECAWVLWQNAVMTTTDSGAVTSWAWKPNDSFASLEACRRSRDVLRKLYPPPEPARVGAQFSEYACFPDPVDPRGPKGGAR